MAAIGPFISGVSHRELSLGEAVSLESLKAFAQAKQDEANRAKTAAGAATAARGSAGQPAVIGRASSSAGPTLKELIDVGLLRPGQILNVNYKGQSYKAPISKEGLIQYEGNNFSTASAFSVFVKRLQTPNKAGDDGWKSVQADGRPLSELRAKYSSMSASERSAVAAEQPKPEPAPPPDYAAIVAAKLQAAQQQAQAQAAAAAAAAMAAAAANKPPKVAEPPQRPPPQQQAASQHHPANIGYSMQGASYGMAGPGGFGMPPGAAAAHLLNPAAAAALRGVPGGMISGVGRGSTAALQAQLQQQQAAAQAAARQRQMQHQHQQAAQDDDDDDDEPQTDQWVQCSKCQTWRLVPDEFWPDIANADDDEDWTCKEALWDVEEYEPHTAACC